LTREEREDPVIWRIVEEVQDLAANYGIGGVVDARMAQLGRDTRLSPFAQLSDGFEGEWTDEEDEEAEESQEEEEENPSENAFPRMRNLGTD
jgi:hypothetical protein